MSRYHMALLCSALLLGAVLLPPDAGASALPGRARAPRLIGPAAAVATPEGALRFAWSSPAGATRHAIVVSETPFDPTGWTRLPESGFRVLQLAHPVVSFQDLGIAARADQPLYWAAASASGPREIWSFSESREARVTPKFANKIAPSPYLEASPIGRATIEPAAGPRTIRLASGHVIDPRTAPRARARTAPAGATTQAVSGTRSYLVAYGEQNPEEVRARLLAQGAKIVSYVPDHAFLVRGPASAGGTMLQSADAWVGDFLPDYKLEAQIDRAGEAARPMTVMAFLDADLSGVAGAVAAAGGRVVRQSDNGINKLLNVEMSGRAAAALAQHGDVLWIEPYVQPELHNASASWVVQTGATNNRRIWTMGLHGEGQVFHHSDSGIYMTHEMFSDGAVPVTNYGSYPTHRKVISYDAASPSPQAAFSDHPGSGNHGSHTGGTTAGEDLTAPIELSGNPGMAYLGKIWHSDLAGPAHANGLVPPDDLNDLFQPSYTGNAGGAARISTNSWGAPVNGAYTVNSLAVDQFMWNHPDYLVFISAGNSTSPGSVGAPASAKSCVTVGGVRNGAAANNIYTGTSRGPALDGRRKPTIAAPAQSLSSAQAPPNSYASLQGTSMACPAAAGNAGLMRQYCMEGWYPTGTKVPANGFTPSAALLKAMVVNSGWNNVLSYTAIPNNDIGYGRMNIDSTLFFAGDARGLALVDFTTGLGHGQAIEYKVNVVANTQPLEVALVWTDFPGNPAATTQLVNNLNLTVSNGANVYKGNVYSAGNSITGGVYDNLNVEEAVQVRIPAAGIWTIRVEGTNVPVGPQPFGLAITGALGTTSGILALDRAQYGSGSTVQIEVTDTNAGSPSVTLTSTTEPGGETVSLAAAGTGIFNGSLPLSPLAGSGGDGTLQVSDGDVITATYNDASPAATLTQSATVSFYPPVITNVAATSTASGVATVTWTTNINGSSKVYYGLTPALGSATALDPAAKLSHAVGLTGLTPGASYYFDVESQDLQGNVTRDDNGGQHYRLTVRTPGDLLVVYGGFGFERESRYDLALQSLGWLYDTWTGGLSDNPPVGNLTSGMRSYDVVWWQPQLELYPPIADAARDSIDAYLAGGGRMALTAHDVAWAFADPTSDFYTPARAAWVVNTLKSTFVTDPPGWSNLFGVAGDPISGTYTGGIGAGQYAEHRTGASGDEVTATGAGATHFWNSGDASPAPAAVRWDSGSPLGTPGSGTWGGHNSRLATMFFEWSGIDPLNSGASANRTNVMQKTLVWLLGRDKPSVTVTAPNGGETITTSSTNITWTESVSGAGVGSRTIEYSLDGGVSWSLLTNSAGPSPYSWDLTSVPNTTIARVRVRVTDDGTPAFNGQDASNASFAIQRAGGDVIGPAVVAGSVKVSPNPLVNTSPSTLNATASDLLAGGSNIVAAEWSTGSTPLPAGAGHPMTGSFASSQVAVTATLPANFLNPGMARIWVRGQDAAGNWGNARSLDFLINGVPLASAGGNLPKSLELRPSAPNPVQMVATIRFGLPTAGPVRLAIYDIVGRRVRTLVDGERSAGTHAVQWDRADERGRRVQPGIYFTRLEMNGKALQQKLVTLK